tara:strand:+ start:824 stop:2344 length:1521 start_codon:yes stop_codon:yes gene_type:complete
MDNHFKIIIPLYNVEKWIKVCLMSVKKQNYKNFECIVVDDISTDNSVEIIKQTIKDDDRFKLVINKEKKYALKNIYEAILLSEPKDEDIIVTLDGDDWLAGKDVLSTLNQVYNEKGCWLTYGSYAEYPSKSRGKFAKRIPNSVIQQNQFREHEWCSSHLRTFKHHLWKQIRKEDLLDTDGQFYRMTWDLAFMFPMLEMSGNKSEYVNKILYVYNLGNPLNDHKVDNTYQRKLEAEIRNKAKYKKVSKEYVTINIVGPSSENTGLGNQLFCIASAIGYAKKHKKEPTFPDINSSNPMVYKYKNSLYSNLHTISVDNLNLYQEESYRYKETPNIKGDVCLNGYFQSYKHFEDSQNEIKDMLNIDQLKAHVIKKYGDFSDYVSLHVRRGDYIKLSEFHNVLCIEYYKKAMSQFEKDVKFLVFSDDLAWCKANMPFVERVKFVSCDYDYEEMLLMSTCKSNIIANSTFSWWAAWLNNNDNKVVIYPEKWFGPKNSHLSIEDLCPKEWRRI